MACAAVALAHSRVVLGAELARSQPLTPMLVLVIAAIHCSGVLFAAGVLPRLYDRGPRGRAAVCVCAAAFGIVQFAGIGWWSAPGWVRLLAPACGGGLIGATLWLFFTRVPKNRQPVLFGLSLAAGMLVKCAVSAWAAGDVPARLSLFSALSAPMLAAALLGGLGVFRGRARIRDYGKGRTEERGAGWVFAALAVFCVMNGAMLGGLIPLPVVTEMLDSGWTAYILLLAPLCVSLLLRKGFAAGFGRIVGIGSVLFLIAATLSAADVGTGFYRHIHAVTIAGQTLVYPCLMLALARLTYGKRHAGLFPAFAYLAAVLTGYWANGRQEHLIGDASLAVLASLAFCVAFHLLAHKVKFDADDAEAAAPDGGTGEKTAPTGSVVDDYFDMLSHANDLSPREREIAAALFKGRSMDEIAASLFIASSTVRTHVRHIRRKLDLPSHSALTNAVMPDEEEE